MIKLVFECRGSDRQCILSIESPSVILATPALVYCQLTLTVDHKCEVTQILVVAQFIQADELNEIECRRSIITDCFGDI